MSDTYIGEIFIISWPWAPNGSGFCDGTVLQINQNQALYSLIGNIYGGTSPTTFALPDLRSRFALGTQYVNQPGAHAGAATATLPTQYATGSISIGGANLPAHTHPLTGSVAVTTTVATTAIIGNQPKPGGNILAKGQDAVSSSVLNNFNTVSDGTTLGGVASTVSNTLAVGPTGSGTALNVTLPVSGGAVATVPPYLTVNYVISLIGIYPMRP